MASTLTYGFVKPATGDKGTTFWGDLEDDIQQMNDHTHNGVDSAVLSAASVASTQDTISSGGWTSLGGGNYSKTVTMPLALTGGGGVYEDYNIQFRNASTGAILYLSVTKTSSTSFDVYSNTPANITVIYS